MKFRSQASLLLAASLAALLVLSACSDNRSAPLSAVQTIDIPAANPGAQANQNINNPTLEIPVTYPVKDGDELTLVWQEEFNGPEIDPEVWFFATGDGTEKGLPGGWGNNELQYYLPDNAMIVNGVLEITARRETVGNLNYTSARINTEDRFAFQYGRIEASIKLPSGQGLWPAFWMLSQDSDYLCGGEPCIWAAIGEIDIMEAVNLDGTGANEIYGTIHYGGEAPGNTSSGTVYTPSVDVTEDFHTYALEWDEDEIRWYFDGELYLTKMQSEWFSTADNGGPGAPFNQPFHILLNLAVGGNFPGSPNGTTPFPATMEVDWVRVYSGEGPPADSGAVPENGVFVTDPNGDATLAPPGGLDNFGSGAMFNPLYAGDPDFKPTLQVISGNAYDGNPDVGFVAFVGYDAGFAANYESFSFKVKGLPGDELEVKFFGSPDMSLIINLSTYAGVTDLGNDWYQVTIPMSEFAANIYAHSGFLIGPPGDQGAPFSFLLTDIGFNGTIVTAPADPGTTPDVSLYARGGIPDLVAGDDYAEVTSFGSGAERNESNTGDPDFSPAISVTTGFGYDKWNAQLAYVGFAAGFASSYETLDFKVKGMSGDMIRVKLLNDPNPDYVDIMLASSGYATALGNGWYQVAVPIADFPGDVATASGLLFETIEPAPEAAFTFLLNDIGFSGAVVTGDGELLTNGDFEAGQDPWVNQGVVIDDGGNNVLQGVPNDPPDAGQPFLVNASQIIPITPGETYTLTFRARASVARNMIAGIGLNGGPGGCCDFRNNIEVVPLTTEWQAFTYTLQAIDDNDGSPFGDDASRVLFDMNGEAGNVFIDDVSLKVGSLLTNGNFEAGQDPWVNQGLVIDDGGNNVLQGVPNDPPDAGQPFLVNASQIIPITPAETYVLTFKARASAPREMIAGIGLNGGPGGCCDFRNNIEVVPLTTEWQTFTYTLQAVDDNDGSDFGDDASRVLFDMNGAAGNVFIDDVALAVLGPIGSSGGGGDGELLTNGDFEAGQDPWVNQGVVIDDGGNNVLQGVPNDPPDAGQPFLVNASQIIPITPGETYTLTFRARASVARNMIAGIGLNGGPGGCCDFRNNIEVVPLTTEWQAFTYTLQAIDDNDGSPFGDDASRVLFDMNGEAGNVFIDDVSLKVGSLLTNGNFEAGQDPWVNQGLVIDDGGNNVLQGVPNDPPDAGQPFLVNASQIIPITPAETYVLTFKARASAPREMIAGIGLNGGPGGCCDFRNNIEVVPLTTEWQTFTYTLQAVDDNDGSDFGDDASRVLFDMNGAAGNVFIDDVALAVLGPIGSSGGGGPGGGGNLTINGDFEAGDTSGWEFFPNDGTFTATMAEANGGSWSGNLVASVPAGGGPPSFPVIKQANIGIGTVQPNSSVTISFDLFGSVSGGGGVFFAEFFSEIDGGGTSSSVLLGGGPLFPNGTWTNYTFTTPTGNDVSGGVTLQLKADCGANPGCTVDAYIDNVSVVAD